jgi:hypothetical protein
MGFEHKAEEWQLLINLSAVGVQAVLLRNRNKKPSVPLIHAVGIWEYILHTECNQI